MRTAIAIILVAAGLLLLGACACPCCSSCEEGKACACETAAASPCAGCAPLAAGETGWCPECGAGFVDGKTVACKGSCKANPGGPPCSACVK